MKFDARDRLLFSMEVHQCFSPTRITIFVLMALVGIALVVQRSEISPFAIVCLTVVASLETQFNNILFRSQREFETLSMFPLSWKRIVLIKNVASIVLTVLVMIIMSAPILFFSPRPIHGNMIWDVALYAATIVFPLLHVGNTESLRSPRRVTGWQMDDIVQALGMFLFVVVLSIPYVVISVVVESKLLTLLYSLLAALFWIKTSIPKTAERINNRKASLCSTT